MVKAFVREDYEIEKFNKNANDLRTPALAAAWRVAFLSPLLTGTGQLAILLSVRVGGGQVLAGTGPTCITCYCYTFGSTW